MENLRDAEGFSIGKLNQGLSWCKVFPRISLGVRDQEVCTEKKTEEPKPHELCVCTKHSSVVNAGGGKGGGLPGL